MRLRALHSITAIVPLATFLVWHFFVYATALAGDRALARAVARLSASPSRPALETLIVLVPLAVHAAIGIALSFERRSAGRAKILQRASGFAVLAFLAYHLQEFEIPLLAGRMSPDEFYPTLVDRLSSTAASIPVHAFLYLVAALVAATHLGLGLYALCVSKGIAKGRVARAVAGSVLGAAAGALFLLGADVVIYFAAGERAFVPRVFFQARAAGSADCDLLPPAPPARK